MWRRLALASGLAGLLSACLLPATADPYPFTGAECADPTATYIYGATDVNAQVGNGSLTAGLNRAGTVTVLRSAAASYDNQVKYFATGYDTRTGAATGARVNEGSFAGLLYVVGGRRRFAWLRHWRHTQAYLSDDAPVTATTYRAPRRLGLTVTVTDFATAAPLGAYRAGVATPGADALVRRFVVTRRPGSPVRSAALAYYANLSPVASRVRHVPTEDTCAFQLNDQKVATYDAATHAATVAWRGVDKATGRPASVAVAVGWQTPTAAHEIGSDGHDPMAPPGPGDGYDQLTAPQPSLGGADRATGQPTVALATPLTFRRNGTARADLDLTVQTDAARAVAELNVARATPATAELHAVKRAWRALLARSSLPATNDPRVLRLVKRSLITVLLGVDTRTGAIVASADTQGPYGEDWIRDGAFADYTLDINGFHDLVARHDRFYARYQSSARNPAPGTPPGNWPMVLYVDGVPGGPIPWEIDETGFGAWTLAEHASFLPPAEAARYLVDVYPAIARAADWLTACRDPSNGLTCYADEDDNAPPAQSLHGAGPALLGLRSAVAAAATVRDTSARVARWKARAAQLTAAIDRLYDPARHAYRDTAAQSSAATVGFENGGWLEWPVRLHSASDPRMQGEAAAIRSSMDASLAGDGGAYETVALLGMCHAWRHPTRAQRHALTSRLRYIADTLPTAGTGILGEFWRRWGDGVIRPFNDQPHVWEHALFDLAALCVYGSRPFRG